MHVCAKSLQSCQTLCGPLYCRLPASSVHEILQARTLERVAMPPSGDLPNPGMEPMSLMTPASAGGFFTTALPGKPWKILCLWNRVPLLLDPELCPGLCLLWIRVTPSGHCPSMDQDKTRHLRVCTHEGPAFGATGMPPASASTDPPGAGRHHTWGGTRSGAQLGTGAQSSGHLLVTKVAVVTSEPLRTGANLSQQQVCLSPKNALDRGPCSGSCCHGEGASPGALPRLPTSHLSLTEVPSRYSICPGTSKAPPKGLYMFGGYCQFTKKPF